MQAETHVAAKVYTSPITQIFDCEIDQCLLSPLKVVTNQQELYEVRELRAAEYKVIYPSIDVHNDIYDYSSIIFYARDQFGQVSSTARLVVDGQEGLPEDRYFPPEVSEYRHQSKRLMEFGRFVIHGGTYQLLKAYYRALYDTAKQLKTDIILIAVKPKDIDFHQRLTGAKLLSTDIGVTYGGDNYLACVAWEIDDTATRFFDWVGGEK